MNRIRVLGEEPTFASDSCNNCSVESTSPHDVTSHQIWRQLRHLHTAYVSSWRNERELRALLSMVSVVLQPQLSSNGERHRMLTAASPISPLRWTRQTFFGMDTAANSNWRIVQTELSIVRLLHYYALDLDHYRAI